MRKVKVDDHKRQTAKNNSIYSTRPGICNVCKKSRNIVTSNRPMVILCREIETLEGRQVIKHLFFKVELFNK